MLWKPVPRLLMFGLSTSPLRSVAGVTGTSVARPKPGSVSKKYSTLLMFAKAAALAGSK